MNLLRYLFLLLLLVSLSGCGSKKLRPDLSISATQANFPTAEFTACGEVRSGLGICAIKKGQNLDSVLLSVQGYYKGTIKFSTNCDSNSALPSPVRYFGNEKIRFFLAGKAEKSCGVSFIVSPEYPNESDQRLHIHSFKGHLYIKVIDGDQKFWGFVSKIKEGPNAGENIDLPAYENTEVVVIVKSKRCSVNVDKKIKVTHGVVRIYAKDIFEYVPIKTCVLNGAVLYPNRNEALRFTWFISGYAKEFDTLPIPVHYLKKKKKKYYMHVEADSNTSVVSVDNSYKISNVGKFRFDLNKCHIIRALTIKGRSRIGHYCPNKGIRWKY